VVQKRFKNSGLEPAIEESVHALLSASPFVMPRDLPTHVYNLNAYRAIDVANCAKFTARLSPDLDYPLTIVTEKSESATRILANTVNSDTYGATTGFRKCFIEIPYSYAQGQVEAWRVFTNYEKVYNCKFVASDRLLHINRSVEYALCTGLMTATSGDIIAQFTDPADRPNLYLASYDVNGQMLDRIAFGATVAGDIVTYVNQDEVPDAGVYFALEFDFASAPYDGIFPTHVDFSNFSLTIESGIGQFLRINPLAAEAGYQTLLQVATQWSITSMSLLVTNMQSDLNNGGTIAAAVVPYGTHISLEPGICYSQVTQLPYNSYNGQLSKGSHCSYLGERIQDYYFRDVFETDAFGLRAIGGPSCYSTGSIPVAGSTVDSCNVRVAININYEFIIPSRIYTSVVSNVNLDYFVVMLAALKKYGFTVGSPLVGENPDHLRRIKTIAKKIAADPHVREAARHGINALTGLTKAALPALLSIL